MRFVLNEQVEQRPCWFILDNSRHEIVSKYSDKATAQKVVDNLNNQNSKKNDFLEIPTVQVDSKGNINLGREFAGCSFLVNMDEDKCQIILSMLD